MATKIIDKDKGFKIVKSQAKNLGKKPFVKIGVQGAEGSEDKKVRNNDGSIETVPGITVVEIANFHEYGLGVPDRSFIRSALDENRNKYVEIVKQLQTEIALMGVTTHRALLIVGEKIKSDIVQKISDGIDPPLAEATIKNKTVNGRTGETPLIDTGQLRQSITYVVED